MRFFNRLVSSLISAWLLMLAIVTASGHADQQLTRRTSNVHPVYSSDVDSHSVGDDHVVHDVVDSQQSGPSGTGLDWAGHSNPYSRNSKFKDETDGSFYQYPQPEINKNYEGSSPYGSEVQHYRPLPSIQKKEYGHSRPSKNKGKDKDHLWKFVEHFFDKKKQLEDEIWDLILFKGHHDGGHHQPDYGHYGEPPSSYHGHEHKLSKEEVFKKVKLLAIAATVLLIVLGGGILLAPLAIGKGRRRSLSEFLQPQNVGAATTEIARLAGSVLQAVQHYHQQQTN
ncbi:Uncharacterized protein APZ42_023104 [Daphnia magna]|uniref:Uncharacterized protein n=1 Tax=Daphnia magna TaxID=35525 RepID=A0A164V6U9_9CRUS|nr:Uncharacterized protein APZ42_023104 [Daphnia magna]